MGHGGQYFLSIAKVDLTAGSTGNSCSMAHMASLEPSGFH
jgi:hypothetical protein